jgi:hypothetical protein
MKKIRVLPNLRLRKRLRKTAADSGTEGDSPELLAMDFVVFRNYLLSEHPGLYRYKSRERLEMLFDSCLLSIDKPESQAGFARKILFAISEIQDGHTGSQHFFTFGQNLRGDDEAIPALSLFCRR